MACMSILEQLSPIQPLVCSLGTPIWPKFPLCPTSLARHFPLLSPESLKTPRIPLFVSCCSIYDNANQAQFKVGVGPVNKLTQRVYSLNRKLGSSSDIIVNTLPKPLGIVFELSKIATGRIFVAELVQGGNADRASRVNQMFESKQRRESGLGRVIYDGGVRAGDLLRATTMVNVVVDLFGLRAPQRVVLFFEVDGRSWAEAMGAIQTSFVADGPVTLILERQRASIS